MHSIGRLYFFYLFQNLDFLKVVARLSFSKISFRHPLDTEFCKGSVIAIVLPFS